MMRLAVSAPTTKAQPGNNLAFVVPRNNKSNVASKTVFSDNGSEEMVSEPMDAKNGEQ